MLREDHNRQQAQDISVILEMGFSLDLAKLALHQAGNVEEAILFCLEQGEGGLQLFYPNGPPAQEQHAIDPSIQPVDDVPVPFSNRIEGNSVCAPTIHSTSLSPRNEGILRVLDAGEPEHAEPPTEPINDADYSTEIVTSESNRLSSSEEALRPRTEQMLSVVINTASATIGLANDGDFGEDNLELEVQVVNHSAYYDFSPPTRQRGDSGVSSSSGSVSETGSLGGERHRTKIESAALHDVSFTNLEFQSLESRAETETHSSEQVKELRKFKRGAVDCGDEMMFRSVDSNDDNDDDHRERTGEDDDYTDSYRIASGSHGNESSSQVLGDQLVLHDNEELFNPETHNESNKAMENESRITREGAGFYHRRDDQTGDIKPDGEIAEVAENAAVPDGEPPSYESLPSLPPSYEEVLGATQRDVSEVAETASKVEKSHLPPDGVTDGGDCFSESYSAVHGVGVDHRRSSAREDVRQLEGSLAYGGSEGEHVVNRADENLNHATADVDTVSTAGTAGNPSNSNSNNNSNSAGRTQIDDMTSPASPSSGATTSLATSSVLQRARQRMAGSVRISSPIVARATGATGGGAGGGAGGAGGASDKSGGRFSDKGFAFDGDPRNVFGGLAESGCVSGGVDGSVAATSAVNHPPSSKSASAKSATVSGAGAGAGAGTAEASMFDAADEKTSFRRSSVRFSAGQNKATVSDNQRRRPATATAASTREFEGAAAEDVLYDFEEIDPESGDEFEDVAGGDDDNGDDEIEEFEDNDDYDNRAEDPQQQQQQQQEDEFYAGREDGGVSEESSAATGSAVVFAGDGRDSSNNKSNNSSSILRRPSGGRFSAVRAVEAASADLSSIAHGSGGVGGDRMGLGGESGGQINRQDGLHSQQQQQQQQQQQIQQIQQARRQDVTRGSSARAAAAVGAPGAPAAPTSGARGVATATATASSAAPKRRRQSVAAYIARSLYGEEVDPDELEAMLNSNHGSHSSDHDLLAAAAAGASSGSGSASGSGAIGGVGFGVGSVDRGAARRGGEGEGGSIGAAGGGAAGLGTQSRLRSSGSGGGAGGGDETDVAGVAVGSLSSSSRGDSVTVSSPGANGASGGSNGPRVRKRVQLPYLVAELPQEAPLPPKYRAHLTLKQPNLSAKANTPQGNRTDRALLGTFATREAAANVCEAYAPPLWSGKNGPQVCVNCNYTFALLRKGHHCRNCGLLVCTRCSSKIWPSTMLPATFHNKESNVRICDCCHIFTEKFADALRSGDIVTALAIFRVGNVNLHCPLSIYKAMEYPVHCAAMGGNLTLLRWLVEERMCPLEDAKTKLSLCTSSGLTPLALAARAGHAQVMRYLVQEQRARVTEITDMSILLRGLHASLEAPGPLPPLARKGWFGGGVSGTEQEAMAIDLASASSSTSPQQHRQGQQGLPHSRDQRPSVAGSPAAEREEDDSEGGLDGPDTEGRGAGIGYDRVAHAAAMATLSSAPSLADAEAFLQAPALRPELRVSVRHPHPLAVMRCMASLTAEHVRLSAMRAGIVRGGGGSGSAGRGDGGGGGPAAAAAVDVDAGVGARGILEIEPAVSVLPATVAGGTAATRMAGASAAAAGGSGGRLSSSTEAATEVRRDEVGGPLGGPRSTEEGRGRGIAAGGGATATASVASPPRQGRDSISTPAAVTTPPRSLSASRPASVTAAPLAPAAGPPNVSASRPQPGLPQQELAQPALSEFQQQQLHLLQRQQAEQRNLQSQRQSAGARAATNAAAGATISPAAEQQRPHSRVVSARLIPEEIADYLDAGLMAQARTTAGPDSPSVATVPAAAGGGGGGGGGGGAAAGPIAVIAEAVVIPDTVALDGEGGILESQLLEVVASAPPEQPTQQQQQQQQQRRRTRFWR